MKKQSLKSQITRWYAGFMALLIIGSTIFIYISSSYIFKNDMDHRLTFAVERVGDFITFREGVLQFDERLLKIDDSVSISIYDAYGNILYGDVPRKFSIDAPFSDGMRKLKGGDTSYLYKDTIVEIDNLDSKLRVRGVLSESTSLSSLQSLMTTVLIASPVIIGLIMLGGWFVVRKALSPVTTIQTSASNIVDGKDLSHRIDLPHKDNEFYKLTETLNDMLERLYGSFEREKEFTDDVAHELRTPLTTMKLDVEVLLLDEKLDANTQTTLKRMKHQIEWMAKMTEDMLLLSRGQDVSFHLEKLKLKDFIAQSAPLNMQEMLELDFEDDLEIVTDAAVFSGILWNLVDNGFKYGAKKVTIKAQDEKTHTTLCIIDDGCGIPSEFIPKIWKRFYRVDPSRNAKIRSSGLGLSIVKWGVDALGWEINVHSTVDVGTTFAIIIPKTIAF